MYSITAVIWRYIGWRHLIFRLFQMEICSFHKKNFAHHIINSLTKEAHRLKKKKKKVHSFN